MKRVARNKVVFRFAKVKSRMGLRALLAHNMRVAKPKNADISKSHLNLHSHIDYRKEIHGKENLGYLKPREDINSIMHKYHKALGGKKPRKNAVYAHEYVISGSSEQMSKLTRSQQKKYFKDSIEWLKNEYGKESKIIHVSCHFDEKTPHAHILIQPIYKGKLNSSFFVGGLSNRMAEYQTRFEREVSLKFGFERGEKNSKATHKDLHEYHKLVNEELPGMRKMAASWSKKIKEKESKNNALTERLKRANEEEKEKLAEIGRLNKMIDDLVRLVPEKGRLAYHALVEAGKRYGMICDNLGNWFDIPAPKHEVSEECTPRELTSMPTPTRRRRF